MRVASILSLLALGAINSVVAQKDAPTKVKEMQWQIEYAPGETEIFTGTIQQVHARLMKLNPEYHNQMKVPSAITPADDSALAARREEDRNECYAKSCKNNKELGVSKKNLRDVIAELRSMKATPFIPPNVEGDACPFAACDPETGAAVVWCNSNDEMVTLGSNNDIANAVEVIMGECTLSPKGDGKGKIGGKRVHGDGITVEVKKMKCPGQE